MHEHEVSGRPVQCRWAAGRREVPRRRGSGPRPVRPAAAAAVAVRPAEAQRPWLRRSDGPGRIPSSAAPGMRLLVRRPLTVPPVAGWRVRRVVGGLAVAVVVGAVVVGLGLLADMAAGMRGGAEVHQAPVTISVTVGSERTAWDVARRLAPDSSGPELVALAERIVTDNSLGPVSLRPGQVLRVTSS
jgi:hypothetical protein